MRKRKTTKGELDEEIVYYFRISYEPVSLVCILYAGRQQ